MNAVLSSIIKTLFCCGTARTTTMTSSHRLSALTAITLGAALSMTAGLAVAGDVTSRPNRSVNALQPKPLTRGLSMGPQADPAVKAKEIGFHRHASAIARPDRCRSASARKSRRWPRASRRSISRSSSTIIPPRIPASSVPAVQELGQALSNANLQGLDLCRRRPHRCDRQRCLQPGSLRAPRRYHQALPHREVRHQRRRESSSATARASRRIRMRADETTINRRVQVVNMDTKTASK